MEEGEDRLLNVPYDFHTWDIVTVCMHAWVHTYNQHIYKMLFNLKMHYNYPSYNKNVNFVSPCTVVIVMYLLISHF